MRGSWLDSRWDGVLDRLSSVAVIVASVTVVWAILDRRSESPNMGPWVERLEVGEVVPSPPTAGVRGNSIARIAVVEFSDFECPYCARHARDVYPRLMEEFVDAGRVQYVFRHYPIEHIHPSAFQAAEAVECAGRQGAYWKMHDLLFAVQGASSRPDLMDAAGSLGLGAAFETCLDSGAMSVRVREDMRYAERLGITSTPTFLFAEIQADGTLKVRARMDGAGTYAVFESTLEELLSETAAATRD